MASAIDHDLISYVSLHGPVETATVQHYLGLDGELVQERLVALAIVGSVRRRQSRDGVDLWSRRGQRPPADPAAAKPPVQGRSP